MASENNPNPLSRRELEIIALAVEGLTDKEICRKLGITLATIRTHWVRLRQKQGTVNRAQAIATALHAAYTRTSSDLRQSEERFRLIVESAKDYAIFTQDPERLVTSWNEGAKRVLGFSEEEILGRSGDVIFTPEDRERGVPEEEMQGALKDGCAEDQRWHVRADGSLFWANGMMRRMDGPDGEHLGYLKIMRDETERHHVEEQNRHYAAIIHGTSDAVMSCDLQGRLVTWNPGAEALLGYSAEEVVGQHASLLVPDDLREESARNLESVRHGEPIPMFDTVRLAKDGRRLDVALSVAPVWNEKGEVIGMSANMAGIAARKAAEHAQRTGQ